jgi:hypothetical protein
VEFWLWFLLPFFVGVWLTLCFTLSWLGGWRALGELYPAGDEPEGQRFGMQNIRCGWIEYNACVTIVVTPRGLYLAVWPLFRSSHPPLLLPWSSLHVLEIHETWWAAYAYVAVDNPPVARLRLPLKVVEVAQEYRVHGKPAEPPQSI